MFQRRIVVLALSLAVVATACGKDKKDEFPTTGTGLQIAGNGSTNALSSEWNVLKGLYNGTIQGNGGSQSFTAQVNEQAIGGATYATMALQSSGGNLLPGLNQSMYLGFISRTINGNIAYYNFISQVIQSPSWAPGHNVAFQLGLALTYNGGSPQAAHSYSWMELLECQQSAGSWSCGQAYSPALDFNFL